jgi:starch phosphorylase
MLADFIRERTEVEVDPDTLFDFHVKRLHEYKRQHLNVLHVITLYNRLLREPAADVPARTVIFGGKAAPGYFLAKLIIKLIHAVAGRVNADPQVNHRLRVAFVPDFNVKNAQRIYPAADLSEQISTAGMEASGTGNMKFALNGALTIGTLDGANVEIREEVGADNIFIFGLDTDQVRALRGSGYRPRDYYDQNPELQRVIDLLSGSRLCPAEPGLFQPIVDYLLNGNDHYMVMADFADYMNCQDAVDATYCDREQWIRKSIYNVAHMGKFSSDRAIAEYAKEIWDVQPLNISLD